MRGIESKIQILRIQDTGNSIMSGISNELRSGLYASIDEIEDAWKKHETPDLPNREIMVNGILTHLSELRRMCWISGVTVKRAWEPTPKGMVETEIDPWFPQQAPEELRIRERALHSKE